MRTRRLHPDRVAARLAARPPFPGPGPEEKLLVIAADHPARGALAAGGDPFAMADRRDLIERIQVALSRPGVHGFLGTADLVEDLALLGALDGKLVLGSMNRAGLAGSTFEVDDRFTAYDPAGIAASRLDGGKMLLRIVLDDPASATTLAACADAVDGLAERGLLALVEPFVCTREAAGVRPRLTAEAMVAAVSVAAGLGRTSAYTWLKVPVVPDMERVLQATTLPCLLLGGEVPHDVDATLAGWRRTLALPNVAGLAVGRSLLYPRSGDVAAAVDEAVALL
ncbi:deoxyribose-phosphate aldolase [Auraticoccus sp. F435]|uniref:Deoxyribose-phosphate aldolase n=1 Tax=Auraticoccus cholistanensis TaxID=2656650 RepID=A0A6A9UWT7_9ACTN|nr:deoxyribose-phosphate aldolase [Auraticoccus cholistanensis]MVA77188.1 deoxyribose-phosphate aldolase [Auraticoccus cholistanensis]